MKRILLCLANTFIFSTTLRAASVTDLLTSVNKEEALLGSTFTLMFQKTSGDATNIAKLTVNYFESNDCSGSAASHTTPNASNSFSISNDATFGLNANAAWNLGASLLGAGVTNINSIGIFFKSSLDDLPQANFTGSCGSNPSICCVAVDCADGQCTAKAPVATQNFTLKTTYAIGDPANGGIIGCINTGLSPNTYNVIITREDFSGIWGGYGTQTNAILVGDGYRNTTTIIEALGAGSYAASVCFQYTVAGLTPNPGWYLPAIGQLKCIYEHQNAIGGFDNHTNYWSSTEYFSIPDLVAYDLSFASGHEIGESKNGTLPYRCVLSF